MLFTMKGNCSECLHFIKKGVANFETYLSRTNLGPGSVLFYVVFASAHKSLYQFFVSGVIRKKPGSSVGW